MKINFKYLILTVFVIGYTSCVEYLDRTPDSVAFSDTDVFSDVELSKNFVHQLMVRCAFFDDISWGGLGTQGLGQSLHGKDCYGTREVCSDNMFPYLANTWVSIYGYRGDFTTGGDTQYFGEGATQRYSTMWKGIRIANMAIQNIDMIENGTQADKNYILGIAYFCRAHFYFMLVQGWGGMPYITEPMDPAGEMDYERLSYIETCKLIAEDFETAIQYLPETVKRVELGYPTKIAAKALKAKALVWAASPFANTSNDAQLWIDAAKACGEVLSMANNLGLDLVPIGDWKRLFLDSEYEIVTKEVLFARFFDRMTGSAANSSIPAVDNAWGSGSGVNVPSENLAMCFTWSNGEPIDPNSNRYRTDPFTGRDPRFYHSFIYNGAENLRTTMMNRNVEIWHTSDLEQIPRDMPAQNVNTGAMANGTATTGYYDFKINSTSFGSGYYRVDHIVRLTEMYLWYAEAANRAWGPTGAPQGTGVSLTAADALNKVRMRANLPAISAAATESWLQPGTTAEFEKLVRNEIRIETAMEERRFYDLRRWRLMQDPVVQKTLGLKIHQNADGTFTYRQEEMPMANQNIYWVERHYLFRIQPSDTRIGDKFKQNPGW